MNAIETVMWGVMLASLVGTFLNVKADDRVSPSARLKAVSFTVWIFTNAAWVAYDVHKAAYPQAVMMACYFGLAMWGLWKFRGSRTGETPCAA